MGPSFLQYIQYANLARCAKEETNYKDKSKWISVKSNQPKEIRKVKDQSQVLRAAINLKTEPR